MRPASSWNAWKIWMRACFWHSVIVGSAMMAAATSGVPRSIWDRYGIDTPARPDIFLSDKRAPSRWFLMKLPTSRTFMTGVSLPGLLNTCKSPDNSCKHERGAEDQALDQFEPGPDLPNRFASAQDGGPGEGGQPGEALVVERAEGTQDQDEGGPGGPRCSVPDLDRQPQSPVEHRGTHQAFRSTLGDDLRGLLHDGRVRPVPARHHVWLGPHGPDGSSGITLELPEALGTSQARVDRGHCPKRHPMNGNPAPVHADVNTFLPACQKDGAQNLLLQWMVGVPVRLQGPALSPARGQHAAVLARTVGVDAPSCRVGRQRFIVPGTHRRAPQSFLVHVGPIEQ